jgi:hypothetical protein
MTNRVFAIFGLLAMVAACTFTTSRSKPPVFAGSTDTLAARLNVLVTCKKFSVDGTEITSNGKPSSMLEIDVINGKNIPDGTGDPMVALAKSIGSEVKKALKDTGEYDEYKVLFVTLTETSTTTRREYKGKTFKSAEL